MMISKYYDHCVFVLILMMILFASLCPSGVESGTLKVTQTVWVLLELCANAAMVREVHAEAKGMRLAPTYNAFLGIVDSLSSLAIVQVTDGVIAGALAKKIEGVCSPMVVDHCFAQRGMLLLSLLLMVGSSRVLNPMQAGSFLVLNLRARSFYNSG
ncbi:hypothetical protein L484_010380 [Morus notabilis]|uniref:CASP-like protein n=1 Tax=Morus notabilis TaxID=981085 RepID=W9SA37_9ROSA|nr:hypothetical protein L484_010380 [Morus notabilis]